MNPPFAALAVSACLSAALCAPLRAQDVPSPYSEYYGTVERVIDGDTLVVVIDLWPGFEATYSVRVRGIDAPELSHARCPQEPTAMFVNAQWAFRVTIFAPFHGSATGSGPDRGREPAGFPA